MKRSNSYFGSFVIFAASLTFLVLSANTEAHAFFFKSAQLSFDQLSTELQTPEKIARYMWRHFLYENDKRAFGKEEHWQTPAEFFESKKGDCEDFAIFAKSILSANGISSFLLNVYGKDGGHTVCVFQENGKFNVIDGTKVIRHEASSLEELSRKINPSWEKGAIVAPSKTVSGRGQILKSFEKRMQAQQSFKTYA